jgi:DNA-binding response OmpR family regulator
VLVIEDRKRLLSSLRRGLEEEGYEITTSSTGEEGYYLTTTQTFDAVVLDLMLPGRNGLQVLRDLRAHGFGKPVLILTSRDAVEDRVTGLDAGADDYMVKPFAFAELVASRVVRNGVDLELCNREFELLEFLLHHRNVVVTRDMIGREVWKEPDGVWTNIIEVYVNALRKKVEQPGQRQLIHTVRGVGYALRDQ